MPGYRDKAKQLATKRVWYARNFERIRARRNETNCEWMRKNREYVDAGVYPLCLQCKSAYTRSVLGLCQGCLFIPCEKCGKPLRQKYLGQTRHTWSCQEEE